MKINLIVAYSNNYVIGNNNDKYGQLEIDKYVELMKNQGLFFDVWNIYDKKLIERNGIKYAGIGK